MILHVKIGTESGSYRDLYGNYYSHDRSATGEPPRLPKPPVIGDLVSWVELENGPWKTGRVCDINGDLYLIERF